MALILEINFGFFKWGAVISSSQFHTPDLQHLHFKVETL